MPDLKREHQVFIVKALACFLSPSEVADAVKAEFGLEVERQQVRHYNPLQNERVAKEWKNLFEETRAAYKSNVETHGIAHQPYRLERLQRMAVDAEKRKNYPLAAQLLEQAAKERGGLYTNKRELKVDDKRKTLAELLSVPEEQLPERIN
jgi:hypothetical protein